VAAGLVAHNEKNGTAGENGMKRMIGLALLVLALLAGTASAGTEAAIDTPAFARGAAVFGQRCAACHDHPQGRIPAHYVLSHLSADQVRGTLTAGPMRQQAEGLSPEDIGNLVVFLTYKNSSGWAEPSPQANLCKDPVSATEGTPEWGGWGRDTENSRFQPDPGIAAADVPRLKLKWAFAYPGSEAVGEPTRAGNLLLVPSATGRIFALDARTGCTYWTIEAGAPVKTAISVGTVGPKLTAFFGDMAGFVHAVDALTGRTLWTVKADPHALAQVRGSPTLYKGRLYAPVSSGEESAAVDPTYPCCTFRGALVAFDAATGRIAWKAYTIPNEPEKLKVNSAGTQMFGPSGAPTWSAPTIDAKRNRIYIGTGNGYSGADRGTTDAVMAFDLDTGKRLWATQGTTQDIYVVCAKLGTGNCPDAPGQDIDFASATVLQTLPDGKQLLLAGQKSGVVFAFDPDNRGKIVWQVRLGQGGAFGGVEHGITADGTHLYVPISDIKQAQAIASTAQVPHKEGGLTALALGTGKTVWHMPAPPPVCGWGTQSCSAAQPASPTAMPGIVFSGSLDGHIRAYATADGHVAWDFDTGRSFDAVNSAQAHGGAVTGFGQIVAGGILYVNSGGGYYGPAGNALLAFSVDGK
jgi:polyvinyl alcohol dehydrogenase (cytochrome)